VRVDGNEGGSSSSGKVCCICIFVTNIIYGGMSEVPVLLIGCVIVALYLKEIDSKTFEI
jgi:hypothetical protein